LHQAVQVDFGVLRALVPDIKGGCAFCIVCTEKSLFVGRVGDCIIFTQRRRDREEKIELIASEKFLLDFCW
jgi:hypothetical protein